MFNILSLKNTMTNTFGRTGLVLAKHSPEILLAVGITGVVASTVMACRATLRIDEVTKEYADKVKQIKNFQDTLPVGVEYTEEEKNHDLTVVYANKAVALIRLYAPSVALGAVSIGCIISGHHILSKRNLALAAAYKVLDEGYQAYRRRVVEEYGEQKDRNLRYGIKEETVTDVVKNEETGKKEKVERVLATREDPYEGSIYAKFFDEYSTQWTRNPMMNLFFLKTQQNWANDLLRARGHVFLNEVYDMLGIPRTTEGAIVGWIKNSKNGDDMIDFDIYNPRNANREFVNGYNPSILLDFNVDGVIYNLI